MPMNQRLPLVARTLVGFGALAAALTLVGCSDDDATADADADSVGDVAADGDSGRVGGLAEREDGLIRFGEAGSTSADSGRGSFVFGAATAASQLEDQNDRTDWWYWTLPEEDGSVGQGVPVGEAVQGFTRALEDVALVSQTDLDSYRFSVEWARVEPERDVVDSEGLAHYRRVLDALAADDVEPTVTIDHFSNPIWMNDFVAGSPRGDRRRPIPLFVVAGEARWRGPDDSRALVHRTRSPRRDALGSGRLGRHRSSWSDASPDRTIHL